MGFSIGTKGYLGTGTDQVSSFNDFWEYNPATNAWLQKANVGGGARYGTAAFVIGGKGYVCSGTINPADLWEYNPATDTWLQKANLPGLTRGYSVGFAIGYKGYVSTGDNSSSLKDLWEYTQ